MTDELEQMSPNQRRALDKALSALEAFASIWAAEIRLSELSARIAAVPTAAERANRIAAMIEQGFIEGAYRHYLDHKDKCTELEASRTTPADHSAYALQMLVAAGHIPQAKVDEALAIVAKIPGVGDAQSVRDAWSAEQIENLREGEAILRKSGYLDAADTLEAVIHHIAPPQKPVSEDL